MLRAPAGAAALAGACAAAGALDAESEALRQRVACPRAPEADPPAPEVLCGDGVCRHTFLACARAMLPAARAAELAPEGGAHAERALLSAAPLLRAIASHTAASQQLFPALCHGADELAACGVA